MNNKNNLEIIPTRMLLENFKTIIGMIEDHTGAIIDRFEYNRKIPSGEDKSIHKISLSLAWGNKMELPEITGGIFAGSESTSGILTGSESTSGILTGSENGNSKNNSNGNSGK